MRHTTWSANERATHNGVDVEKRAVGNNDRAWRFNGGMWPERTTCRVGVLVVTCVHSGVYIYEIDHVVDFTRRTRQLIAYRQDVVYWTLSSKYICTSLNVLH